MNELGFQIPYIGKNRNEYKIERGNYSLLEVLKNDYRKNINSFRKKNLMYVKQLIYNNHPYIKEWSFLSSLSNMEFRSKIPDWWHKIRMEIVKNHETREINQKTIDKVALEKKFINDRFLIFTSIDGRKNQWTGDAINNTIVYGKL